MPSLSPKVRPKCTIIGLTKNDIGSPILRYAQPHIALDDSQGYSALDETQGAVALDETQGSAASRRIQKLTKNDISGPICITQNSMNISLNYNDNLQQASSFNPQSFARINSDFRNNNISSGSNSDNNNKTGNNNNNSTSISYNNNNSNGNKNREYTQGNNNSSYTAAAAAAVVSASDFSSKRSSRLNLYEDGSSDSLQDILEDTAADGDGRSCNLVRRRGIKSKSFDGLTIEGVAAAPTTDGTAEKALSVEQLDTRRRSIDSHLLINPLSYRNRSNSMDFKTLSKDNLLDGRNDFIDKGRKFYSPNQDKNFRRRSLVLEEGLLSKQYKPFQKLDEVDVSLVLDAPPKLPPKQRKQYSTNPSLGNPVDGRLNEIKDQNANTRRFSREFEPSKHIADIDHNSASISSYQTTHRRTDTGATLSLACASNQGIESEADVVPRQPPVAMPRKLYPPPDIAPNFLERSHTCIDGFDRKPESRSTHSTLERPANGNGGDGVKEKGDLRGSFKEKAAGSTRKGSIRKLFSKSKESSSSSPDCPIKNKKLPKVTFVAINEFNYSVNYIVRNKLMVMSNKYIVCSVFAVILKYYNNNIKIFAIQRIHFKILLL